MAEQLSLAQAFQNRPGRFRLLKKGIERTGWKSSSVRLLEAGCSVGDAAAMLSVEMGFDVTAFDHEPALVSEAIRIHGTGSRLHFDAADASALPYPEASFEGLYSEAAFSPMIDKSGALAEYRRVLKPGSLVLINDFVDGCMKGGFKRVTPMQGSPAQFLIQGETDNNVTRFSFYTCTGNLFNEDSTDWIVVDVQMANGSNRMFYKIDNLSFKSLGKWLTDRVIHGWVEPKVVQQ